MSQLLFRYSTPFGPGHSGAYLFLPDSEGETIKSTTARVIIVEGRLISQVIVEMPKHVHVVTLYNSQGIYCCLNFVFNLW